MGPDDDGRRITVWGAPSTGKTTFLGALNIALDRQDARWRVGGADEPSAEALTRFERALVKDRVFPDATQSPEQYHWQLIGTSRRRIPRQRWWQRSRQVSESSVISMELMDAPGESADPIRSGQGRAKTFFDAVEKSHGIIYFVDPVREMTSGDTFEHTHTVINALTQRMSDQLLPNGRLRHYVAVCVTKFDDLDMVRTARHLQMIDYDDRGVPRVPDDEARDYLLKVSSFFPSSDMELAIKKLERNFSPDRIRYFITSAIGFHVDPKTGKCNPNDFQNHLPAQGGRPSQIRGDVHPVNVAEPVIWLAQVGK